MRILTKTSTARCNLDMYTSYLLSEPDYTSCSRLSAIMHNISHDSVNRFLERENYTPVDLFNAIKNEIAFEQGILSIDVGSHIFNALILSVSILHTGILNAFTEQ